MNPDWFSRYIATPYQLGQVDVAGVNITYQQWSSGHQHSILFVHGHAAHAHWWDFIAPAFSTGYNCVAINLSGAGDSGHRQEYSAALFADELAAVCLSANIQKPVIIAHSFGGSMARIACHLQPELASSLVIVDSLISTHRSDRKPPALPKQKTRYYPTVEAGMKRFRLRPPQPCENDFIVSHIARHSLVEEVAGFKFKLDQAVFAKMDNKEQYPDGASMIRKLNIPVGMIYGEQSRFFGQDQVELVRKLLDPALVVCIPGAHHHVFLDQPLAFIESTRSMLQQIRTAQ